QPSCWSLRWNGLAGASATSDTQQEPNSLNWGKTVRQRSICSAGLPGVMLLTLLLVGCAGPSGTAPVDDRSRGGYRAQQVTSGSHVVQRGDTLYSIAFRYGWDWKALAANNNLRAPYTIYPGQRLSLAT